MILTAEDLMTDLTSTPNTTVLVEEDTAVSKEAEEDFYYESDYSPVSGHGHALPEHYDREKMFSVEVINVCDVIGKVIPGYWDMPINEQPNYAETDDAVEKWVSENDAHFFSWEGPSFGSMAMENEARANAVALGKSKVVIESLS